MEASELPFDYLPLKPVRIQRNSWVLLVLNAAAAVAISLLLSACSFRQPYPLKEWGPLPTPATTDCRDFADRSGWSIRGNGGDDFAAEFLSYSGPVANQSVTGSSADRLTFSFPDDRSLEVMLWIGKKRLTTRTLTADTGQFVCGDGRLILRPGPGWMAALMAGGGVVPTFTLMDSASYLFVREEDTGIGRILFVPVWTKSTSWYRFPRAG